MEQATPLIGRQREIVELLTRLRSPEERLLTLVGPGGVGKTSLARQVARMANASTEFADHVRIVDLAAIADPDLVIPAIAESLGIIDAGDQSPFEGLKQRLWDQHYLLVLDNFERVLDAAPRINDILSECPSLKVLVTSRVDLGLSVQQLIEVHPLATPDPNHVPPVPQLVRLGAVQLLVARARATRVNFSVTDENAREVAEICARLDGLPLAIELVAPWLQTLSPQQLSRRMERSLPLLKNGHKDAVERHRTMTAAIAWSYDRLSQPDQYLLQRLAVFADGCTLEAAEAVCTVSNDLEIDVLSGLHSLGDKSLISRQRRAHGAVRFRMLETIREYALDEVTRSGELNELRQRHALYFLKLAEDAEPHLTSHTRQAWLPQLTADLGNLRAALEWARLPEGDPRLNLRLAGALPWFWYLIGQLGEGRRSVDEVLERTEAIEQGAARAKALLGAGGLAWAQGDFDGAYARLHESYTILEQSSEDTVGHWVPYVPAFLGIAAMSRTTPPGASGPTVARPVLERSLAHFRAAGNRWGEAFALNWLGDVTMLESDPASAFEQYNEAWAIFRSLGDDWGCAWSQLLIGQVYAIQGDFHEARAAYHESAKKMQAAGDRWSLARVLVGAGDAALRQKDYKRAQELLAESLTLCQEVGNRTGIILCLAAYAQLATAQNQAEWAARLFGRVNSEDIAVAYMVGHNARAGLESSLKEARCRVSGTFWQVSLREGRAMSLEDAIVYVQQGIPSKQAANNQLGVLTQREVDVTREVALGLTDREIAEKLSLSVFTVSEYVKKSRQKLYLANRTKLALWAREQGLADDRSNRPHAR